MAFKQILTALFLSISTLVAQSQCVVINEILVNAAGACDGSCTPSTGEWFELYNTCTTAVDISCYVITDGDFAVTFPVGTFIEANGFLVIGSINSGVAIDIDLGSCGCTTGGSNQIGIFTNGNEQLALVNAFGEFQDGVYWGTGQFSATPSFTTDPIGTCGSLTIPLDQSNPIFVGVASQSNNEGFTINRACDGGIWQSGGQAPTPGESNGGSAAAVDFSASNTSICAGECINYINETAGTGTWTWTFEGSDTGSSTEQSPSTICYPNEGTFDVTLTVDGSCGTSSLTLDNYIIVSPALSPLISVDGPVVLCEGESTTVQANFIENIQWYNQDGLIVDAINSSLLVTEQGTYYFTVTSGSCVYTSESVAITVAESANVALSLTGDAILCPGEIATLTAPEGFDTYVWFDGETELANMGNTLEVATTGSFSVEASIGVCSAISEPVSITLVSNPEAIITSPSTTVACPGEVISLEGNVGMSAYAWYESGSATIISSNATYEISNTGDYYLVITDANGCSDQSDIVSILVETPISIELTTADNSLCEGDETVLLATESDEISSYTWFVDNDILGGEISSSLTTSTSGDFSVMATSVNGCEYMSNTIAIIVSPIPKVSIFSPSEVISCEPSISLLASTTSAAGGNWTWFDQNGNTIGSSNPATINNSGSYIVSYVGTNGCSGVSAPVLVTLLTAPAISIIADDTTPCAGENATLLVENNGGEILWSTDETTETIEVSASGNYDVEVTFDNGCVATDNISITVQPLPIVNAGSDVVAICGLGTILDATAQGTYTWSPTSSLDNPSSLNPLANPTQDTYYTLTATLNGCTASSSVWVYTDCGIVKVPNVFTPNNDGVNDTFEILTTYVKTYHIEIYNRWGDLVFTSDDEDTHWDGKINGNDAEGGTYFYLLQMTGSEGESLIDKDLERGSLTLLR